MIKRSGLLLVSVLLGCFTLFAEAPSLHQTSYLCEDCNWYPADVNGDGLDDVIDLQARQVRFNRSGVFSDPVPLSGYAANEYVHNIDDYNGDGFADLVLWPVRAAHDEGPNRFAFGNGDGTFRYAPFPTQYGGLGQQPPRDFDRDGRADLVLWSWRWEGEKTLCTLSFLHGNGDGTFRFDQSVDFLGSAYPYMAIADFNGDGHYDLVRTGDDRETLYFHYSGPDGRLGPARERYVGANAAWVREADLNGDSLPDLVLMTQDLHGNSLVLMFNDGRGRFPQYDTMGSTNSAWGPLLDNAFAGGGDELAIPHSNGRFVVYGATGNALHEIASLDVPNAAYYWATPAHFRSSTSRDYLLGIRDFSVVPNINRSVIVTTSGQLDPVANARSSPRKARAITVAGGIDTYDAIVTGGCAPPSLNDWAFTREGVFLDFTPRADGTQISGAIHNEKLATRVTTGDRVLRGTLTLTPETLRGYLYNLNNSTVCTGRVLVDAKRVE